MAQLSVEIVGETKKLEKALKDSERSLKNFESKAKALNNKINKSTVLQGKLAIATEKVEREFAKGVITQSKYENSIRAISKADEKLSNSTKNLRSNLTKTNKSIKDLGGTKGFKKLEKSTISGNSAMTAFSRTIQDAPFGIMGVSNNITNLTEQFGYLKNKTGSAGGALKAMLRDLKGFGGISLAISVATSLMLVFGDKIFATKDKVKALRKEQEDLTKSLDDYLFQLGAVDKANLKGGKSAAKQIVKLNLLKGQIEDTTLSNAKRLEGVNELRRIYPSYLQNITDEKALNGGLKTTYDDLTTSIMQRAKATASMDMMVDNQKKLINYESQLTKEIEKQERARRAVESNSKQAKNYKLASAELKAYGLAYIESNKIYNKSLEETKRLQGEISKLTQDNVDLSVNIKDVGGITPDTIIPPDTAPRVAEKLREVFEVAKQIGAEESIGTGITGSILPLNKFDIQAELFKSRLQKFNEDISGVIEGSLKNTFAGIGQAIGEAMANGGNLMSGLGKALLSNVGSLLTQLGKMAIGVGVGIKAIKAALQTLNPFAAIGAGVALVALGSAFSAGASKIASSGGGSSGNGGTPNGGADRFSPRSSNSSSVSSSGGGLQNVVFEIQGTKLVGVLSNTLARNRNLGGSLGIG